MNTEKMSKKLRYKYTVETGWRETYEFCHEQRIAALQFAEIAVANKQLTEAEVEAGKTPKVTITIEEEV